METNELEVYVQHPGTVLVAGQSSPIGTGRCAAHFLDRNMLPIDFLVIGPQANQQATKAMGCFRLIVESELGQGLTVMFQPLRFGVNTRDPGDPSKTTLKDAIVWRTFIIKNGIVQSNPQPGESHVLPRS